MKRETRHEHSPVRARSREASERAAHLAPPEEREAAASRPRGTNAGAVDLDIDSLRLRDDLLEKSDDPRPFRPDPVVILIFFLSLAFIAFITYLIYIEPLR